MAKSKSLEALDDLFGVQSDGSNIVSEESHDSYGGASEDASFADKANFVKGKISSSDEIDVEFGGKPSESEKVKETKTVETVVEEPETIKEEAASERPQPSEDFESILKDAVPKSPSEPERIKEMADKETSLVEDSKPESKNADSVEVSAPSAVDNEENQGISDLEDRGWQVACPSPMWNEFYRTKKEVLRQHALGREVDFGVMYSELKKAKVDIRISLSDHEGIHSRMQDIQRWRDRVVQMRVEVNMQYFLWKRLVPLFEGQVAMVQYEKPAAKQEGLIHSRMNDMITYLSKLESMYETTKDIIANLDAAYDSLSRQVTMSMSQPTPDRQEQPENQTQTKVQPQRAQSPRMSDYDSLEDSSKSGVKASSNSSTETKSNKSEDGKPEEINW